MHDLNDLYYFAQVVQHGGFTPAATALGIQKSKLSRRIALLEERLGVKLIHRSPRHFSVTEVGQSYYRHCLATLLEAESAQAMIENVKSIPQGVIRIACPPGLLLYRLAEAIARFMAEHPKIQMQVKALNRRVDILGEGYDIAIRVGQPLTEPAALATRKLGEVSQCLVTSPLLLQGRSPPETPSELALFPTLDFGLHFAEHPTNHHEWLLNREDGAVFPVSHRPRLVTDDLSSMREAALVGIGIAQLPSMMIEADIASGRLVVLLPSWQLPNQTVHAIFPSRRSLLPSIRALLDFLTIECLPYRRGTLQERATDLPDKF